MVKPPNNSTDKRKLVKKKYRKGEQAKDILKVVAGIGFILALGIVAPNAAGHIIKMLGMVPDYRSRTRVKNSIKSLERRGLVTIRKGKNDYFYFEITDKGKAYWIRSNIDEFKLSKSKEWDGLWRVITFDIPEEKADCRRRFSAALNLIGMFKLEKSIYIFPYDCRDTINKIITAYEINEFVRFMLVKEIEKDREARKFFKL